MRHVLIYYFEEGWLTTSHKSATAVKILNEAASYLHEDLSMRRCCRAADLDSLFSFHSTAFFSLSTSDGATGLCALELSSPAIVLYHVAAQSGQKIFNSFHPTLLFPYEL